MTDPLRARVEALATLLREARKFIAEVDDNKRARSGTASYLLLKIDAVLAQPAESGGTKPWNVAGVDYAVNFDGSVTQIDPPIPAAPTESDVEVARRIACNIRDAWNSSDPVGRPFEDAVAWIAASIREAKT